FHTQRLPNSKRVYILFIMLFIKNKLKLNYKLSRPDCPKIYEIQNSKVFHDLKFTHKSKY
ncbi:MAG: hypothetical protein ACK559_27970, partial [bacterium]